MAEQISFPAKGSREEIYLALMPQIEALIQGESDQTAVLANVSAVLREAFGFLWVGFYLVKEDQLVLGPFQGTLACTRIARGRGVCGTAWEMGETQFVPDVEVFPGHIACSSLSRSEVVVPIFKESRIVGVLDVDSDKRRDFSQADVKGLEQIAKLLSIHVF